MNARDYVERAYAEGELQPEHVVAMTRIVQRELGLTVDGKPGPETRASLVDLDGPLDGHGDPTRTLTAPIWRLMGAVRRAPALEEPLRVDAEGWLQGEGVVHVPAHRSWYYANRRMRPAGKPGAIVCHYTATDWGTARAMARRRKKPRREGQRAASWHFTAGHEGLIFQMIPLTRGAWHAGSPTARPVPGLGIPANYCAVGAEIEGHGEAFPEAQVVAIYRAWRAIVRAFPIPRERAMIEHRILDPTRRRDPGDIWMERYAESVLDFAYAA